VPAWSSPGSGKNFRLQRRPGKTCRRGPNCGQELPHNRVERGVSSAVTKVGCRLSWNCGQGLCRAHVRPRHRRADLEFASETPRRPTRAENPQNGSWRRLCVGCIRSGGICTVRCSGPHMLPVLSAPAQGPSATPSCNVDPDWPVNPVMTALRGRPLRVVAADASDDLRSHLRWLLSQLAVEISAVATGGEIVMLLAHDDRPIDLLITNVELPWMSGIHVALSGRNSGFTMPMILLAARPSAHLRNQVNSLGAALLVGLPFRDEDLLSTVREQLRSTPREMESAGGFGGIDLLKPRVAPHGSANHGRRY
jgi:CheY-like chemotaxis protein